MFLDENMSSLNKERKKSMDKFRTYQLFLDTLLLNKVFEKELQNLEKNKLQFQINDIFIQILMIQTERQVPTYSDRQTKGIEM